MKEYFDWASDKYSFARWDDSALVESIDRRMNKRNRKNNKMRKQHRKYA